MVALDRPGYGSSAPYPEAMALPEQRVNLAYGAVDRILGDRPRGAGLFLMGHSGGCELVMRMGADERGADLLGIELAGTGRRYHPAAREILKTATRERRPAGLRELLWHPEELYPPEVLTGATVSPTAPSYEDQMVSDWARQDFPGARPRRACPGAIQHRRARKGLAERYFRDDRDRALFSGSPRFTVHRQPDAGHNMSLGHTAAAYHAKVLCVRRRMRGRPRAIPLTQKAIWRPVMRVGFIGLGSQGGPMARRIVEGGFPTTLWARRPATLEPFADTAGQDRRVTGRARRGQRSGLPLRRGRRRHRRDRRRRARAAGR